MRTLPEIEISHPLGRMLANLAAEASTIVEIGTGSGLGSTKCLHFGASTKLTSLITVEADQAQHALAVQNMSAYTGYIPIYGVLHNTIRPYSHPYDAREHREMWDFENAIIQSHYIVPNVLSMMPRQIDLLFLDGGEFTSDGDFLALWQRSKVIVLDDCNKERATKNAYAYEQLLYGAGYKRYITHLHDRNGWAVFTRE